MNVLANWFKDNGKQICTSLTLFFLISELAYRFIETTCCNLNDTLFNLCIFYLPKFGKTKIRKFKKLHLKQVCLFY